MKRLTMQIGAKTVCFVHIYCTMIEDCYRNKLQGTFLVRDSYLYTYDLCGPVHHASDVGSIHYKSGGVGPWKSGLF